MKYLVFALIVLLAPAAALSQCSIEGDVMMRYGFGQLDGIPYNQPGPDYANIYAGQTLIYTLGPCNIGSYNPHPCTARDTLCFSGWDVGGWTLAGDPPFGEPVEIDPGYLWYNEIHITAPCNIAVGQTDTVIAKTSYVNLLGVCDPSCADCADPNVRPSSGVPYYNSDTLILTIVSPPPSVNVLQDTLTILELGQTAAYVPFTICNQNECAPLTTFYYSIFSAGHIPMTVPGSDIDVAGGDCEDVFAVMDASYAGSVHSCTYDTLTMIAWSGAAYDTCVQVVHVVEGCLCVPTLSAPFAGLLLLALLVVAGLFVRRRLRATT